MEHLMLEVEPDEPPRPSRVELFRNAIKGQWDELLELLDLFDRDDVVASVLTAKITTSGDTALHMAVSNGLVGIVERIVDIIKRKGEKAQKAIRIGDNRLGNTPLHLAAALGNVRMCECMSQINSQSLFDENNDGETPLFLAALNGKKDAFLYLHSNVRAKDGYKSLYRRKNKDTILHCAIFEDYLDLALQIIQLDRDLAVSINDNGLSPLHILARKPRLFKSGTYRQLGWLSRIIYDCTIIKEPLITKTDHDFSYNRQPTSSFKKVNNLSRPENCCSTFLLFFKRLPKVVFKRLRIIAGMLVSNQIRKIKELKEMNTRSLQVMDKLLKEASFYGYEKYGMSPQVLPADDDYDYDESLDTQIFDGENNNEGSSIIGEAMETPILMAASNGITEMVERILDVFPEAIQDMNKDKKNITLLAAENKQTGVYQFLIGTYNPKVTDSLFRVADNQGNSVLHLAAKRGDYMPQLIPVAALQWEIKWFKFVENSMPSHLISRYNAEGKTPKDIFIETHRELTKDSGEWLMKTAQSCSVVAALIATVAFTILAFVPGGTGEKGKPNLQREPAFKVFAVSSLFALSFSVASVVMFLAILMTSNVAKEFGAELPRKLLLGLSSLFVSIASIMVSFCAGNFLMVRDQFRNWAYPAYILTCLPTFLAMTQFPMVFDLIWALFIVVPRRSFKVLSGQIK